MAVFNCEFKKRCHNDTLETKTFVLKGHVGSDTLLLIESKEAASPSSGYVTTGNRVLIIWLSTTENVHTQN